MGTRQLDAHEIEKQKTGNATDQTHFRRIDDAVSRRI